MSTDLTEKINRLPLLPGVYQFKDESGTILYVGKAKKLRNRVRSYFQNSRNHDGRIKILVSKITDLDVIVTDSEAEALILENNLIKQHAPRYNVMYRDDKSYPYICITKSQKPRIFPTRSLIKDGSRYFGPYDSVVKMRSMLEMIKEAFDLCSCACSVKMIDRTRPPRKWHSCFDDYLNNCSGDLDNETYNTIVEKVIRLLNGKTDSLIRDLKEEMLLASQDLKFEFAARIRDGIVALRKYSERMKIVANDITDRDIFAIYVDREEDVGCGVLFKIREGKMMGKYQKFITNLSGYSDSLLLQSFIEDYYTSPLGSLIPDEVYLSDELEQDEALFTYLNNSKGKKVMIHKPKIGEKAQLTAMAKANARLMANEWIINREKKKEERIPHAVKTLKRDLQLKRLPRRIDCFDNSNFQGSDPVASMVCFVDAKPRKSEYKKFIIKTVTGSDDFASMYEVVTRRYTHVIEQKQHIPDLIVIDGGKGQLSSAVKALKDLNFFGHCDIIGLAKRLEEVYLPGYSDPIMIPKTSSSLKLLQQVRDEAHRFAITFHRQKRMKRILQSELESVHGIGKATAEKMITHFGSVEAIKSLPVEEIAKITGLTVAHRVKHYFNSSQE